MILKIYRCLTYVTYPFIRVLLWKRRKKGKEDTVRYRERMGYYTKERPEGQLVWIHGASVGECLSTMPLIEKLVKDGHQVMLTSGTVTSATLMEKRLPKGAFHQYVPVDYPSFVRRFLKHFKPDIGMFIESDFWPNLLSSAKKFGVPLILLNGRISDKSFARWQKALFLMKPIQNLFTLSFGQTQEDARRLQVLGAQNTVCVGNLKFAANPPPLNEEELKRMKEEIGTRHVWVAGSTHEDEEKQEAEVHILLKNKYPDILTIMAPRHPERCDKIEKELTAMGLSVHRRTRGEDLKADVYIADTIGEMGLIYRLAPLVFVGGSLVPFGGQNMLEPMRAGACTVIGPHAFNFKEIVARSKEQGALAVVENKQELAEFLDKMWSDKAFALKMGDAGQRLATSEVAVLDRVCETLTQQVGL